MSEPRTKPTELDRTQAPAIQPLAHKAFPQVHHYVLDNGLEAYLLPFGTEAVAEVQLVYEAGLARQAKAGVEDLTLKLLQEGSKNYTGRQLAERFEDLGAFVGASGGFESAVLSMSVLNRKLDEALPLLSELVIHATFPEEELALMRERLEQKLAVEEAKTSYQARLAFRQQLFGAAHPYTGLLHRQALAALSRADVQAHYESVLHRGNYRVIVAGRFEPDAMYRLLNRHLGILRCTPGAPPRQQAAYAPTAGRHRVSLQDKEQATLRLAVEGPSRKHAAHHALKLLTLVLGGYFGSRLMANLREAKGYTYGVGASYSALPTGGFFMIGTDVGQQYVEDALAQCHVELARLREELIPEAELEMARSYFLGRLIAEQETPFQMADRLKSYLLNELPTTEYSRMFEAIKNVTAEELRALAQQHWPEQGNWVEVVAG